MTETERLLYAEDEVEGWRLTRTRFERRLKTVSRLSADHFSTRTVRST
jgi:hypothetical protein